MKTIRLLDFALKTFKIDKNKVAGADSNKTKKTIVNLSNKRKNNRIGNLLYMSNIGAIKIPFFLIPNAKKAVNYLKLAFIKAQIF